MNMEMGVKFSHSIYMHNILIDFINTATTYNSVISPLYLVMYLYNLLYVSISLATVTSCGWPRNMLTSLYISISHEKMWLMYVCIGNKF